MTGHSLGFALKSARGGWALGIAALFLMAVAPPSLAQDRTLGAVMERLDRMDAALRDVQREVFRSTPRGRPGTATADGRAATAAADVELRIGELEATIAAITGSVEETGHRVDVFKGRLEKLVADVDFRLTEIENSIAELTHNLDVLVAAQQAAAVAAPPATAQATAPQQQQPAQGAETAARSTVPTEAAPQTILPDGTPQEQYAYARSLLTRLDYQKAEQAFIEFLARNGDDDLAGNAQYWLGETYYVRQKYADAATAFVAGFQQFPTGNKAPDNLLKLGMSLAQLGQKEDACATLQELLIRFTDAEQRITRRAEQEQVRIGC